MKMMEIKVTGGYLQYKSDLTFFIGSREAIFSEPCQNAVFCRLAGLQPNAKNQQPAAFPTSNKKSKTTLLYQPPPNKSELWPLFLNRTSVVYLILVSLPKILA
jgi:hypothetical protein